MPARSPAIWRAIFPAIPTIVVKNMPGAGSTRAGIYISTVAPKDGGSVGALMPGAIVGPLLEDKPMTQFDPTKVIYIGTADTGVRVCATYQNSKINSFAAAQKNKTILGASSAGGATRDYAFLHNHTAGTQFSVVAGYKGTVDIALAMERGEVDGLCGWDWSSVKSQKSEWVRDKKLNILVQVGLDPQQELTDLGVPTIWTFVKNENDRRVAELVVSQQVFQRSYIVPPGTPAEQIEDPAHRVRRHDEGPAVPRRRNQDEDLDHTAVGPAGAGYRERSSTPRPATSSSARATRSSRRSTCGLSFRPHPEERRQSSSSVSKDGWRSDARSRHLLIPP